MMSNTKEINDISEILLPKLRERLAEIENINDEDSRDTIINLIFEEKMNHGLSNEKIEILANTLFYRTRRRLSILQPLLDDERVIEIMVNGPHNIFYEKDSIIHRYDYTFFNTEELENVMQAIAGDVHREINEMNPIVDARLNDGSRVNGVYKNVAVNGPILTIRKFAKNHITLDDMVTSKTISRDAAEMLKVLVICGYNMFISGGTSSGKTTFLNAVAESIPKEERVIVIEDSMELKLDYIENIVHMECRNANSKGLGKVNMSNLIKSSLRMRPNRIIVGEVRGEEVMEMLAAMNTGHQGSMSTGHGNSVSGMLKRLETMYLMALPMSVDAIRQQIAEGIDLMVHLERQVSGKRSVVQITEINGYENGQFLLNPLFEMEKNFELKKTGNHLKDVRKIYLKGDEYANRLQQIDLI